MTKVYTHREEGKAGAESIHFKELPSECLQRHEPIKECYARKEKGTGYFSRVKNLCQPPEERIRMR